MYQSVYVDRQHRGGIHRDKLHAHMQWLSDNGWHGCAMRDYGLATRGKEVFLTFDDGYENNLLYVLPLLRKFGFKSTFFVCTRMQGHVLDWHINDPQPLMGADGWQELARNGHEVASHGLTHRRADLLDGSGIQDEIERSRDDLERIIGSVDGYAYPQGYFNRIAQQVAQQNYRYACSTRLRGRLRQGPWTLKRINIGQSDDVRRFAFKMSLAFRLACDFGY